MTMEDVALLVKNSFIAAGVCFFVHLFILKKNSTFFWC